MFQKGIHFFGVATNKETDVAMRMWNVDAESVSSPSSKFSVLDILLKNI